MDYAKKRSKESKQLAALIERNKELKQITSDEEGNDTNYLDYDPIFDGNQQKRNEEIRLNKILIDTLQSGKIDDEGQEKIKTQLNKLESKLPKGTPVYEPNTEILVARQDKPKKGIKALINKKTRKETQVPQVPSPFVRVRF